MSVLEDMLRDLAKKGELNHIGVGADASGKRFVASYRNASTNDKPMAAHADPVEAMKLVIKEGRVARVRMTDKPKPRAKARDDDLI